MPVDPKNLVVALRRLVNASNLPGGPSYDVAQELVADLEIPEEWLQAMLKGWVKYAKRYKRPRDPQLVRNGKARFLASQMLPVLELTKAKRKCRLCGYEVPPPARSWHKECWAALEPETAFGWRQMCRQILDRAGWDCEKCGYDLEPGPGDHKRQTYDIDHIVPLALGGEHSADNLQALCIKCHKGKTKSDMTRIAQARRTAQTTNK